MTALTYGFEFTSGIINMHIAEMETSDVETLRITVLLRPNIIVTHSTRETFFSILICRVFQFHKNEVLIHKYHAMKSCEEVKVICTQFLTPAVDVCERSSSNSGHFVLSV
jgi:hypothetical protein